MGRKKKKQVKPRTLDSVPGAPGSAGRSKAHKEFFTGGLSRKGHAIPPKTTYDRRKRKKDLEEGQSDAEEPGSSRE